MKKYLLLIIAPLIAFGAMYLCGSFANISFDISKWGEKSREYVAIFGFIFAALSVFLVCETTD